MSWLFWMKLYWWQRPFNAVLVRIHLWFTNLTLHENWSHLWPGSLPPSCSCVWSFSPTWDVGAISCWLKGWGSPQQTKYPTEMMGFAVVRTKADITFVRNALVHENCLFGLDPESFIVPRLSEVLPSQGVNRIHQTQLLLQNKPLS